MKNCLQQLQQHQQQLGQCQRCPQMHGPPVIGKANLSEIMLIGQAPGHKEIEVHRPFAWTAGKTLFKWFAEIGMDEATFRNHIYMAAVCRCFPGKNPKGGDRVPNRSEISHCSAWLQQEIKLLQPKLILPVGKLAISQIMPVDKLTEVVGVKYKTHLYQHPVDVIPLPHPSGASTWHRTEPGKSLLQAALKIIKQHSAWKNCLARLD